jgi:hypothetical protein
MGKISALLFLFFSFQDVFSQSAKADSIKKLLQTEKIDSNRVTLLWNLAKQYQFFKPDTTILLAQQAQLLASRIKFTSGSIPLITKID